MGIFEVGRGVKDARVQKRIQCKTKSDHNVTHDFSVFPLSISQTP
jgi:hypothetical protein